MTVKRNKAHLKWYSTLKKKRAIFSLSYCQTTWLSSIWFKKFIIRWKIYFIDRIISNSLTIVFNYLYYRPTTAPFWMIFSVFFTSKFLRRQSLQEYFIQKIPNIGEKKSEKLPLILSFHIKNNHEFFQNPEPYHLRDFVIDYGNAPDLSAKTLLSVWFWERAFFSVFIRNHVGIMVDFDHKRFLISPKKNAHHDSSFGFYVGFNTRWYLRCESIFEHLFQFWKNGGINYVPLRNCL